MSTLVRAVLSVFAAAAAFFVVTIGVANLKRPLDLEPGLLTDNWGRIAMLAGAVAGLLVGSLVSSRTDPKNRRSRDS